MKYLIVNTIPKSNKQITEVEKELSERFSDVEVINTEELNIHGCIGCNNCWLKTPGICGIKDDYEKIFIKFLQVDRVVFLTETKLGFVTYQTKNLFDRILPMLTMNLKAKNGQLRHYRRYKKHLDIGMLYAGEANNEFLGRWLKRTAANIYSKSLGVYPMNSREELYYALNNH